MINSPKFKIREEKNGAAVFDLDSRSLSTISQEEYNLLKEIEKSGGLKKYSEASLGIAPFGAILEQIQSKGFIDKNGLLQARFIYPRQLLGREISSDCTSAPNRIYFEITRRCTLSCPMCYNRSGPDIDNEMPIERVLSVIKEIDKIGVFTVRITGGEPTTHSNFFKILNLLVSLDFCIELGTNAVWPPELLEKINESSIDWFIISLEGPEEVNDAIRGKGSYRKTLESIRSLSQKNKRLRINMILNQQSVHYIEFMTQLCEKNGVETLTLLPPRPCGRASKFQNLFITSDDNFQIAKEVCRLRKKYKIKIEMRFDLLKEGEDLSKDKILKRISHCGAGIEIAFISPTSEMYPCPCSPASNPDGITKAEREVFLPGNILKTPIIELWHHPTAWSAFRDIKKSKFPGCFKCRFYGHGCFGSCPAGAYYTIGQLNGPDPYCYAHLLDN